MKKLHSLLKALITALALLIQTFVFAQGITLPPESSWITFTNPLQFSNMTLIIDSNPSAEAYTETATMGGVACRKIPSGKFMYISCTRSAIPTNQNNLLIAVTYYAGSNNNLWFNYNSTTNAFQGADIEKTKSNDWATAIIPLTNAAFNNNMNGVADFRLGFGSEENYIKEIKVYKSTLNPLAQPVPAKPNSSISEFKNKSFAGYQIWHKAGPTAADWNHWSYGVVPAAGFHINEDIASFPDISEIPSSDSYATNFAALGNGSPTRLYNAADVNIINRQMGWCKTAGVDGVAIQRFVGGIGKSVSVTPTSHLSNVKNACEATGRLFYICYDLNGTDATILQRMQTDWVYEIEEIRALTSSPNYATVNGKPVVEMWGVGYDMATSAQCADLISFFKSRGCYVVGGVPNGWRTAPGAGFSEVFKSLDAVSPWTVGVYNTIEGANNYATNNLIPDKQYCTNNDMDYLPVVFAGAANWVNGDNTLSQTNREGGKFFWQQVINAKSNGLTSVYMAMLDEFEESTNLINGAVDYFDIPTDQYFETFAKDGVWTSSDYYLRLAARASKTLRGEVPVSNTIEVPYSNGPTYFRNSFESRATVIRTEGRAFSTTLKIDPCFYNPAGISNTGITNPSVAIVNETSNTKTGLYSVKATGTPNSATSANYYYKTSETKIAVKANMQVSFWKYSVNALGQYTNVDLVFQSGKRLSALPAYVDNAGAAMSPAVARGTIGSWQKFTCQIGTGELVGDVITGIIIGYDHPSTSGSYTAYFDDIIIEDALAVTPVQTPYLGTAWPIPGKIEAENYDNGGEGIAYHDAEAENKFNLFRTAEAVDVESTSDVGLGYSIGWIATGEWLEYTVNVQTAGVYTLGARIASANAGTKTLHVEMDGVNISGPVSFDATGGWQTFQTINVTTLGLTIGQKVMRIVIDAGDFNLNYVTFAALPPVPVVTSGATASATANAAFTYTITATNTPTSYAATNLPTGLTLNATTGVISGQAAAGTYTITLTASNAGGPSAGKTLTLTVTAVPVVTSGATASATANAAFTYTITATNTPTSYAATNLPTGLTLNATTGVISGQAAAGTYTITLTASNAGGPSAGKTLTLTVTAVPIVTSSATASATANAAFTYTITATNTPTSYAATNLPTGLTLNTTTGVISGQAAAGTYTITLTATNAGGPSAGKTVTLTVTAVPVITSGATASATANAAFTYTITATNTPTSYAATNLPTGLTLNTTTGVISGQAAAGMYTITLTATNAGGPSAGKTVTLTVTAVPVITSGATASATANAAFTYTITATNTPTSYAATNLPTGLTLNTTTGVISGQAAAGTYTITLTASNAGGLSAGKTLTLTVTNAVVAPVITSAGTASLTVGSAFSYSIVASGNPSSYAATGLPAGLTINTTTGVISGTPTQSGTFTVTLKASNTGGDATTSLTLTITNAVIAPVITSAGTASATANAAFTYTITATNTPTSYGATGLPAGLTLNTTTGLISGQAAAGTYTITLTASNAGGPSAGKTLTLTVTNAVVAPVISNGGTVNATNGLVFSYTITASGNPTSYAATGLPDGLTINSATGVISGTPTQSGTFIVTLSASNTAGPGTTTLTITVDPAVTTGLIDPSVHNTTIYPNPVHTGTAITIQFSEQNAGAYMMTLYNALGQSVFQTTVYVTDRNSIHTMDLPQQATIGYYQLEIISPAGERTIQKIVVQ